MKQTTFTLLLSVLLSMVGLHAYASDIEVDGIYYYFNANSKTALVTYKGEEHDSYNNEYTGAVVIPSEVTYGGEKYSVTWIGVQAFYDCTGLTSITIPNSVTSIRDMAFYNCSGLTSVTIPNSVTSIRDRAFYNCSGLTSVTIPNSVTWIGDFAFLGCSGLTSVTIPNSVTSIGWSVFQGCSGLTSVTIPNSVTSIGVEAFSGCSGLTSITIPNSVTTIGNHAFLNCTCLTSITIPNSVTSIGTSAFYGCTGLISVTIPNSVTSIGDYAFSGCSGLISVTELNPTPVAIGQYVFTNRTNATLYVPKGSKEAYQAANYWKEFKEIEEISLPTHKIIYIVDGEKYKSYDIEEGESITPEPAPTKEGYTFSGWSEIPATMPADDVIITGTFEVNKYDLTYSVDGLSKMKMIEPASEHNLTITAEEGWKVVALTVNGEDKMSSLKNNVLTINITADTEVKVTLGWANEANLYTEDVATGIATIEGEGVKVLAKDGQIWVDGAAGKTVRLYTIGGALMTTVTPKADMTGKFSVAAGTYIVQVGNKAAKVVVK